MGKDIFDPTSIAARRLEAQKKQVHRIRLNKQLSKARKRLNEAVSAPPAPTLQPAIEQTIVQLQKDNGPRVRATEPPPRFQHHATKPNPMQRALDKRQAREQQMKEEAEERERQIQAREVAKAKQRALREKLHKKLTATNRKGQPKLSNHIEAILHKIQKG